MRSHATVESYRATCVSPIDTPTPFLPENETEVVRQLLLQQQLSSYMKGPIPPCITLPEEPHILDVGCGVGSWCLEMARRTPQAQIVGIDSNTYCIEQARTLLQPEQRIRYQVQDMYQLPYAFSQQRFDLVHLRFLLGAMSYAQLPDLAEAVAEVSHSKAIIVWHESELPITTSKACDALSQLVLRALEHTGRHFSYNSTQHLGFLDPMRYWLQQVGCTLSHIEIAQIEVSFGMPLHEAFARQVWMFGHQIRPFLLKAGVVTGTDFEALFAQVQREVRDPYFCGVCPQHLLVARKR